MLIDTETITEIKSVDKPLLKTRFGSAIATYNMHADVQRHMARELVGMAKEFLPCKQQNILEIGCGTGLLTEQIVNEFSIESYVGNDLVDDVDSQIQAILRGKLKHYAFMAGDAEQLDFPDKQDSIWSGATIQWVTQLPQFFSRLAELLNPGGYLVVSSFGPDNYHEIKDLTGSGINYQSKEEINEAAAGDFKLINFIEWREQMWFKKPMDVLKHMRYTGVNGISHCQWNKGKMSAFNLAYERYAQSKGYPLTYHPYLMIFKKK
jgi:malonyl-ACP O-methyltransferase BioC